VHPVPTTWVAPAGCYARASSSGPRKTPCGAGWQAGFSALRRPPTGTFGEMGDSRRGMLLRPITPPNWLFRGFGLAPFCGPVSSHQPPACAPKGYIPLRYSLGTVSLTGWYREPLGNHFMNFKSYNLFLAVVVSLRELIDELKIIIDEHQ